MASWISLVAFGHLVFASAAHAQAPAAAPPPPSAQPYNPSAPPPGYPPAAGYPAPAAPPPSGVAPAGGFAPPPGAPAVPPGNFVPPLTAGPIVQINANNPKARLQTSMQLKWRDVCTVPCNVPVDPNATYRIGGGTIRPSEEFRMPRPAGTVLVTTETGSTVKHWVGVGLLIGGGVSILTGALYLAAGDSTTGINGTTDDAYKIAGVTYLVIGGILAAVGLPLSMSSTSVQVR
jgi:hypothetical protein